jgi:hypothetical protein
VANLARALSEKKNLSTKQTATRLSNSFQLTLLAIKAYIALAKSRFFSRKEVKTKQL